MDKLLGFPLLNILIAPTLRPGAPTLSLQEILVGRSDENMLGVIPHYTTILAMLAAMISTYYIVYAGYIMFTAFGDEAKYATGKKTLLSSVTGFAISMLAYFIIRFFTSLLGYTGSY